MPNLFVIAATFNHNRIEKDKKLHFMLQNNNRGDKTFERTLGPNFPLMLKNSQAINGCLIDNESLSILALAHANKICKIGEAKEKQLKNVFTKSQEREF
jgi:hypothetical protein